MSIYESYLHLTRHIVPGPQDLAYFVPLLLLPLSLNTPRSVLSRWQNIAVFMPMITVASITAWRSMGGVDVISVNIVLWATFLIVLQDPWKDYRLVRPINTSRLADLPEMSNNGRISQLHVKPESQVDHHGSRTNKVAVIEQSYPSAILERLVWTIKLLGAITLDNWKISRPSHDRFQPPLASFKDRRSFLIRSMWSLVRAVLILDITRAYIEHDDYFIDPSVAVTSPLPLHGLRFIPPQLFRSMVIGAQAYALIGECFYLPAAIPVIMNGLGILPDRYSPHTWPAYFGSPSAIFLHGVRGFWGSFWHQTMRWSTSGPGYALADALKLGSGSLARYAAISISAFSFSGLVHMGLVPPEPLYVRDDAMQIRLSMAGFFWVQPIALLLEALVAQMFVTVTPWNQGGGKVVRMVANAIWTVTWFGFSLPLMMDAARQLGYWTVWPLPMSLWRWAVGEGLFAWN